MKSYFLDKFDLDLIHALKGDHRLIGYTNRFDENWVGEIRKMHGKKHKGKYKFTSLISIGEELTFKDMGYNDEWSEVNKYAQTNVEFIMTLQNMKDLREMLDKKIKGAESK